MRIITSFLSSSTTEQSIQSGQRIVYDTDTLTNQSGWQISQMQIQPDTYPNIALLTIGTGVGEARNIRQSAVVSSSFNLNTANSVSSALDLTGNRVCSISMAAKLTNYTGSGEPINLIPEISLFTTGATDEFSYLSSNEAGVLSLIGNATEYITFSDEPGYEFVQWLRVRREDPGTTTATIAVQLTAEVV